jgi:hypothetical protein
VTTGKVVSLLACLLCFLLFYFFALSFSITFGKDLFADLVASGLRVSLLCMSSFLCFCFFYLFHPMFVTTIKVVLLLGTLSLLCFLAFSSSIYCIIFLHNLRQGSLRRPCGPWTSGVAPGYVVSSCFCFYLFCLIFMTIGKDFYADLVVLLLGTSSLLCFQLFYFLHYLSPQHSARIFTTILWLLDFGCSLWVYRLFFVSDFFISLFPYLRDHLQGGVAPGYVVFALLSIFIFFALTFSTTFGKKLYADLVAPGLRVSFLGMSSFLCFCCFYLRQGGVAPEYVVFALLSTFLFFTLSSPQPLERISTPIWT